MQAITKMVFLKVRFGRVAFALAAFTLSACGRDCYRPYMAEYVFAASERIALADGESASLSYSFYPVSPYKISFASDFKTNPYINANIYNDEGLTKGLSSEGHFTPPENAHEVARAPSVRSLIGPDNPLNFSIDVSRNDISESEMRISMPGYGSFLVPASSEFFEVVLFLHPEIKCYGDSDDSVYISQSLRVDLQ